jgi:hypothetical protein
LQTRINNDSFGAELKTMTAVIKNTMFSLLCLAGLVLAAPTQSTQYFTKAKKNPVTPELKMSFLSQSQSVAINMKPEPAPSVIEGTSRFSCW